MTQERSGTIPNRAGWWTTRGRLAEEHRQLRESLSDAERERIDQEFRAAIGVDEALEAIWDRTHNGAHSNEEEVDEAADAAAREEMRKVEDAWPWGEAVLALKKGADPNLPLRVKNPLGMTAMTLAATRPESAALLEELLERGGSPWAQAGAKFGGSGLAALMEPRCVAVDNENAAAVRILAKHGAYEHAPDDLRMQLNEGHDPWVLIFKRLVMFRKSEAQWLNTAVALAEVSRPSWLTSIAVGWESTPSALASLWLAAATWTDAAGLERVARAAPLPRGRQERQHALRCLLEDDQAATMTREMNQEPRERARAIVRQHLAKLEAEKEAGLLEAAAQAAGNRPESREAEPQGNGGAGIARARRV
jgi:hypothetical protein